jgi:hypothetical protein
VEVPCEEEDGRSPDTQAQSAEHGEAQDEPRRPLHDARRGRHYFDRPGILGGFGTPGNSGSSGTPAEPLDSAGGVTGREPVFGASTATGGVTGREPGFGVST